MSNDESLIDLAARRIVIFDGAMGSNLQNRHFDLTRDWLGQENISEVLNLTRPEVIQEIHEAFLDVGCDAIETNTFGANAIVLIEAGMAERAFEINQTAAGIARRACDRFQTSQRRRYVVGSIGPGTRILTLGQTTWDAMLASYFEQVRGLLAGGVDALLIETQQDLLAVKCCLNAIEQAFVQAGRRLPIFVQFSFDQDAGNQTLTGSDPSAVAAALEPYASVNALGVNCAFGPGELVESVRYLSHHWPRLLIAQPNAGLPVMVEGKSHFPMGPDDFARGMMRYIDELGVNLVGGCCGTMPEHLAALVERVRERGFEPGKRTLAVEAEVSSLISAQSIRQDSSYLIVAERTNTNGSRQFKRLLQEEDFDALVSMARDEMKAGSHLLDVCVDFVGRDGVRDMREVVRRFVNALPIPLMLDSTNPQVMEAGLQLAGGRCVLNSMNLEDGEEKLESICRLARRYGAAVVAGTIDEDKVAAMARTAERKVVIARRIRDLAVGKFGLRDEDLLFDPLVLPISTGIEEDRRNALETIEGTRRIMAELPKCHTVVGLSNVSFGLKPAARVVLNSVFLHELREAGLTGAIVHASKILPRNRIPDEQWNAALDLIYDRRAEGFDPLTRFIGLFPDDGAAAQQAESAEARGAYADLSVEEKLKRHIIDGEKRHLLEHLDEAMREMPPLRIINEVLLEGMKVVGELFGSGQMQLPFVLQSAETMKASVAHLEPHMEKSQGRGKGRIVLATVKGDVHDIGKNLVDIILTNNGYTVHNLGIKQPVGDILKAFTEHQADAIGMSGLLVKSVGVMKENLEELNARGVGVPVLLGGAALTRDYAEEELAGVYKGSLFYCKDAFDGLKVMDALGSGGAKAMLEERETRTRRRRELRAKAVKPSNPDAADIVPPASDNRVPDPPFWGRRMVRDLSPSHLFAYINPDALFIGQWGFRRKGMDEAEYQRLIDEKARPVFQRLQREAIAEGFLEPKIVYGYFPVQSDGDDLIVYHTDAFTGPGTGCDCGGHGADRASRVPRDAPRERLRFTFPRQQGRRRLCISDFFRSTRSGQFDVLGMQLVTVGDRATQRAEALRAQDRYQDYLYLHGFGVESAEALAELWHKRMRQELGFGSEDAATIRELFHQGYRGSRYSFGYPACPNIEDRAVIAELLSPGEIGVELTENYMLSPEQSTDALVVHHPQARYFDV